MASMSVLYMFTRKLTHMFMLTHIEYISVEAEPSARSAPSVSVGGAARELRTQANTRYMLLFITVTTITSKCYYNK